MNSRSISAKNCPLCKFEGPSVNHILSHLRIVHSHDPNFLVTCGLSGCATTCKSFSALYSHVYRKHSEFINKRNKQRNGAFNSSPILDHSHSFGSDIYDGLDSADVQYLLANDDHHIQKRSALFLLKLKEHHRISQAGIDDIVKDSRDLFHLTISRVEASVKAKLAESGIAPNSISTLDEAFTAISDPFRGLETAYKQEKIYRQDLGLIEPREIQIGESYYHHQFSGTKRRLVETKDTYYYIPVLSTLAQLLKDYSILEEVDQSSKHVHLDGFIEDFRDGSMFKNHPLFSTDPCALQIVAYYDELEICNPLGSHTKKHKLGIVFYTLANIRPRYRSQMKIINLAIVATSLTIEKHTLDQVLEPFISDLNILTSSGITVEIGGCCRTFRGALLAFLADNLASNELGGFKKSFSFAFRWCRTCLVTTNSISSSFLSRDYEPRNLETHLECLESINGPAGSHYSKTYGINRKSALLKIHYFPFFNGGLPHDAMHDILEGVAPLEIKKLLYHLINIKNYFTLTEYNHKLVNFNYGYSEKDKPIPIMSRILNSPDQALKSSASQMLTLLRILPFIIAEKIPEDDKHWKCYLLLRKVVDIVLCPLMSQDTCTSLQFLIQEHHSLFVTLYGVKSYTPKFHFLLHYPDQIISVGPMTVTWTMRHEAKLSFFKKASHISNFKNICLSLANNHQRWMCYKMATDKLINDCIQCGPPRLGDGLSSVQDESADFKKCMVHILPQLEEKASVFRPTWISKLSTIYKVDSFVIIRSDGLDPIIGRIDDLLVISGDFAVFVVTVFKVLYFDDHYHAYTISTTTEKTVISMSELPDHNVYHSHKLLDGCEYITLKHYFL